MKKIIYPICTIIFTMLLFYLFGAFASSDFNIVNWEKALREGVTISGLIVSMIFGGVSLLHNNREIY